MRTKSVMAHNIVGALMNKTAKSKRKQVLEKGVRTVKTST